MFGIKLLRRLLIHHFGTLPGWVEAELAVAEPTRLEAWGERVLETATLDEVFAGGSFLNVSLRRNVSPRCFKDVWLATPEGYPNAIWIR